MKTLLAAVALIAAALIAAPAAAQPTAAIENRFTVTVMGAGPDVILIPGLASTPAVWNDTAQRLQRTHRVHVVQINGFAGAPAGANAEGLVVAPFVASLNRYILARGVERPAVIGHSLGGEAALMLAARHPRSVGRVMAVDALPFFSLLFGPQATAETARPIADQARDGMLAQTAEAYAAAQPATIARLVKDPAARERHVAASLASDRSVVARAMHEIMTTDLRPELAANAVPITVLYAWDEVTGVPAATFDALWTNAYAGVPSARLQRIDGALHFIMDDQPQAFAEAVDAFLTAPTPPR